MSHTTLKFDELNSLSRDYYEEYFGEMGVSAEAKKDRVLIAMALEDGFLDVLAWIQVKKDHGEPFFYDSISLFEKAFLLAALTRVPDDQDIRATANDFAEAVALSTYNHQDDDYYLSGERAINMAATESNAINCFGELGDAIKAGMTVKKWNTIIDGREREWHEEVNGTTQLISEPFVVGGELLMYPLDTSLGAGADNIANCRCWLTFG